MSCSVGGRRGSDLALLWLAAIAPIQPLIWELPYVGAALKNQEKKKSLQYSGNILYFYTHPFLQCSLHPAFKAESHLI